MAFHTFWPALTCLTMFVIGVIIVLLRFGPRFCKTRHTPREDTDHSQWVEEYSYEQRVSYA